MILESLLLATNLLFGRIDPMGYAYTQYPNQDTSQVLMRSGTDRDSVQTYYFGFYAGNLESTPPESQVNFEFTNDHKKAFLIDTIGRTGQGENIAPEVFLYDSTEGRQITASAYRLNDTTGANIDSSLFSATLFNLTKNDSAQGYVYSGTTTFSDVFAHIRADAGDELLLEITAPSGDTAKYVSCRSFTAPDSGSDAVYVKNDSAGIPRSIGNYGHVDFPDSMVMLPRIDFGVSSIVSPSDTVDSGDSVTPRVYVTNLGQVKTNGGLELKIGDDYTRNVAFDSISPGDSALVSFTSWTPTIPGNYAVSCSTLVTGDVDHSNDAKHDSTYVYGTGIHELSEIIGTSRNRGRLLTNAEFKKQYGNLGEEVYDPTGRRINVSEVTGSDRSPKIYFVKPRGSNGIGKKLVVVN